MCKPNYGGIVLLPLLLASCIGGNFGVQPVVESTPTAYPVTFKSKDVPTPPPAGPSVETTPVNQPAVGAAMRLPRRNIAAFDKNGNEIPNSKQAEEYLPLKEEDILFLDGTPQEQADKLKKKINERYPNVKIYTSDSKDAEYKYVRAGYVYTRFGTDEIEQNSGGKQVTHRLGYDGFVYYSGERPSQSLPSAGTVKYSGNWQYMTDVKRHRAGKAVGIDNLGYITFYGNDVGATSYAAKDVDEREKHPAKYTVDFDQKTLNGKLIKNQYVQRKTDEKKPLTIYDITAKLDGNRFTGSAKVNPDLAKNPAGNERLFFHADADQRLEGGFFGDNGEELAGRFISNDKSVFGVFAGKQKTETANASDTNPALPFGKHTKILDSLKISVDEATDSNARKFAISSMPDFGHPDKLLVEGREIPLVSQEKTIKLADGRKMTVSACCDFLTYVKLGRIKTDRPAAKPKAQDEDSEDEIGESEENEDEISDEEGTEDEVVEDEGSEEDEVSESDNGENEEEIAEEETEEEVDEAEEELPAEEGNGGSGSILPTPEAPKGRDIDLFLKGIRTAEADIPKTGKAHYTGTWEARIGVPDKKDDQPGTTFIQKDSYANQGAKAEFDVDFGAKSLSGKLTEKNDTHPAVYIENGVIDGNGFHATARTRDNGIDLSGQGSTSPQSFKANNLLVTGGFYGPQAAELGGNIIDSDRKFGAVFGAKKDNKEVEK
ncbi:TPA: transferrin-binding protein-like solute binding protein [Neisseria meningitidis]|uniref:transferrin-binding protein-like solute binding protein n=1 Tax=Neisseria meningitidis TaxID=487 RepID=UPI0021F0C384|nr:transferrin-binding protein-like solute binding protein [Neisseria meningitidis]MCV6718065.1 transferrin-binding protein-like solute binding protein [Neisseria meningitidis]MCV6720010.1 transferrin-binding protein-like solute binding protein [Neisseria meningitidis]MCV6724150.1 transferrin-binding protein-like solute binding protein [Neisseria meningitidis]MCV6726291.1 transferrin-binding protein-like solute binding protein [Neisseria meningitidis]MCV6734795.1 transferrin-binding protein-li